MLKEKIQLPLQVSIGKKDQTGLSFFVIFVFLYSYFLYMFGGVVNLLAEPNPEFSLLAKTKACFRAFWSDFSLDRDHMNFSDMSGGMFGKGHLIKCGGISYEPLQLFIIIFLISLLYTVV